MSELFLKIVNMSISASWLILAVLILRFVLKKAPKWVSVLLWGIVAVRLICPFSIESALSLIPSAETVSPEIMMDAAPTIRTGIPVLNSAVNPVISQSFAPSPGASANPLQIWIPVFAVVWATGVGGFLAYTAVSYRRLRRKVNTAVLVRDNIYQSENVGSPFVLGIFRPRIYLPFKLDGQNLEHVVAHELAHIRRRDHLWKPLGLLLLAVYWFNPLMWPAYILLCRDIELACDERVIRELGSEQRADYSQVLLICSVSRRGIAACPLAFGEVGVKERVKSVLYYKKPAFWVVALAVIVCAAVAVCFLTDPVAAKNIPFENKVVKWFDYLEAPEDMHWDGYLETTRPEFPGVTFRWYPGKLEAVTETEIIPLYSGMPVWSVYFYDLTGDGLPELCSTLSFGSGLIDDRVIVYDYANGASYTLEDRGYYDYTLRLNSEDGCLYVDKKVYYTGELVSSGRLSFADGYIHVAGDTEMIPTTANLQGAFDVYLYVPFEDGTYRYERSEADPSSVTTGELFYSFVEKADPFDVEWNVYAVKESPDHRVVYVTAGEDYIQLYQYSPSKRVDPNALQTAKENGCVVMEDGECTWGAELWAEFYATTRNGKSASVNVAHYYTLDPARCGADFYEAYKEDYPAMFINDLVYDGKTFTLSWTEQGAFYHRQYKYLMKYEDTIPSNLSALPPRAVTRYVLTNDNTVTWEELIRGALSSQFGDFIDHYSIYTETGGAGDRGTTDASGKYYLTVGAEGVTYIEISVPKGGGGAMNADGSPFRKGEVVWLERLDGLADLRGVTITAWNENGGVVWAASIPDGEENRGLTTHLSQDGWTITNIFGILNDIQ